MTNILADTSVWIEHLRRGDDGVRQHLQDGRIVTHDFVVGELVLGGLAGSTLALFQQLHRAPQASHAEVMHLIAERRLAGRGIGYVDTHLLAAALLGRLRLWTLDKRLQALAGELGCGMEWH